MSRATLTALVAWAVCVFAPSAGTAEEIDFERHVAPLLVGRCAGCHNGTDPSGGLNLLQQTTAFAGGDSGERAIVPGDAAQSNLIARMKAGEMPPPGKGSQLTVTEVARLEAWIQAGAPWPENRILSPFEFTSETRAGRNWWSLQPPQRPLVPTVRKVDWPRNPIDAFVLSRLERENIEPTADADRATFIRRASLDLLGLPPSQLEVEQFVADTSPDAYEKLADRLLASPHYGERWARHWMDVVRFAESNGYETNTARPNAWPYRDWLIYALNDDLPFPQFVLEQLAGDQVGVDAATGFLVGGAHDIVLSPNVELTLQQRLNDLDDIVSTTATAFLGLTIGCAKCHDHKFDPIAQQDYYAMQAIFAGVQHGERELQTPDTPRLKSRAAEIREQLAAIEMQIQKLWTRYQPLARVDQATAGPPRAPVSATMNVERLPPTRARFLRFTALATNQAEPCIDELEIFTAEEQPRNVALASLGAKATASSVFADGSSALHRLEHINDGRYGNSHSWISAENGAGWVQIEFVETVTIDRVAWARDREGTFNDRLATRYKIETSESGDRWHAVATSDDRATFDPSAKSTNRFTTDGMPTEAVARIADYRSQAESLRKQLEATAPSKVYAGTFTQPEATYLLHRGEPLQKRDQIIAGAIASAGKPLSLDASTPEAQRRLALALWIGDENNPLAARVMVNRIWHYHFGQGLVRTPSDFGFHAGQPSHPELLDWLATEFMAQGWRPKAIHRLILLSSTYRQDSHDRPSPAAKDAAGQLLWRFTPRRLEAEAIRDSVLATSGLLDLRMGGPGYDAFEPNTNYVKVYQPKQTFGPAEWRRMVYQHKPRMRQDGTFGEFDCPDSSQTTARRNTSTTALQALSLLNSGFIIEQSRLFAERLEREVGGVPDEQIRRAFWLAFGRPPEDDELSAARLLISEQGLTVFCRALYNANEFLYIN